VRHLGVPRPLGGRPALRAAGPRSQPVALV
jgi:hypothetical protein